MNKFKFLENLKMDKNIFFYFIFLLSLCLVIFLVSFSFKKNNLQTTDDLLLTFTEEDLDSNYIDREDDAFLFPPYYLNEGNLNAYADWENFDSNGIILPSYEKYNPVTISQYAHTLYRYYLNNPEISIKEEFLKQVDWLYVNTQIRGDDMAVWEYDFSVEDQGAEPPWISAMAQGMAISALIEAYSLTDDQKYLDLARKALKPFALDVEEGGVRSWWPDGFVFYEEYATERKYKVLNGFIFALAGIHDLYRFEENSEAKKIFDEGINSLKKHLNNYDALFTSYYSLSKKPTKCEGYHKIHIKQLAWLYYVTDDKFFWEYAKLFNAYCPFKNYSIYVLLPRDIDYREEISLKDGEFFYRGRTDYWSSSGQFPVSIKIIFEKKEELSGFNIISFSGESSPEEYDIIYKDVSGREFKIDKSRNAVETNDFLYLNSLKNYTTQIIFPESIYVKEVEMVVYSDKGNKNLAIKEITPLFLGDDYFIDYYNNLFAQFNFLDFKKED